MVSFAVRGGNLKLRCISQGFNNIYFISCLSTFVIKTHPAELLCSLADACNLLLKKRSLFENLPTGANKWKIQSRTRDNGVHVVTMKYYISTGLEDVGGLLLTRTHYSISNWDGLKLHLYGTENDKVSLRNIISYNYRSVEINSFRGFFIALFAIMIFKAFLWRQAPDFASALVLEALGFRK